MAYTRKEFIDKLAPYCVQDMKKSGILASLTLAQGVLESGNGNSGLTQKANNLFGIKAGVSWKGDYVLMPTKEYINGVWITVDAKFRAYKSWYESVEDHSLLLTNNARYAKVVTASNYKTACYEIWKAGYATDPNYPSLLTSLIEKNNLAQYDIKNTIPEPAISSKNVVIFKYRDIMFEVEGKLLGDKNWVMARDLLEALGYVVEWEDGVVAIYDRGK